MKIKIKVPADSEVTFDEASRELTIEPFFTKSDGRATWACVSVCGDGGAERRTTLQCSGKSGQLFVLSAAGKNTTTGFDKLSDYQSVQKKNGTADVADSKGSIL
jgi:hypothetical protein